MCLERGRGGKGVLLVVGVEMESVIEKINNKLNMRRTIKGAVP